MLVETLLTLYHKVKKNKSIQHCLITTNPKKRALLRSRSEERIITVGRVMHN